MMARVRQAALAGDAGLDHHGKTGLFLLTSLFDRIVWLLRQVGRSLDES
jgi:hypothetical protein